MIGDNKQYSHFNATTILAVNKHGKVAIGGDGQVSIGNVIFKGNATKIRELYNGKILAGFAGATSDAFTLFEHFEQYLSKNEGKLLKSAVDLTKEWRTNNSLRRLEAMMLVANKEQILLISGNGDLIEPEHDFIAIGSGGNYAYAAAMAYMDNSKLSAKQVVEKSLQIAANICIYTNHNVIVKEIS